jgi:hypothetical protein
MFEPVSSGIRASAASDPGVWVHRDKQSVCEPKVFTTATELSRRKTRRENGREFFYKEESGSIVWDERALYELHRIHCHFQ